jgi:purine nucleosidase
MRTRGTLQFAFAPSVARLTYGSKDPCRNQESRNRLLLAWKCYFSGRNCCRQSTARPQGPDLSFICRREQTNVVLRGNLRLFVAPEVNKMRLGRTWLLTAALLLTTCFTCWGQGKRKIIIDQDAAGPAGTDQQSILLLIQSPQTDVLGITVVTGDQWLKAEVAHTLRLLEIIGRTDIPVVVGAEYPLVRRKQETELWEQRYGSVSWVGAWTPRLYHPAEQLGDMPEGLPTAKPSEEDAAHFLVRMVRKFPHEITIYAGGPMTNLALAISIDPDFPKLAKELVFMGASLSPVTNDPEFVNTPRREFNVWFDPEAAHIVFRAPWKKIVCTPVDISVKTKMTTQLIDRLKTVNMPAAQYIGKYGHVYGEYSYVWDELAAAAWLDPSIITAKETRFMDVDLDRGTGYGETLTWTERDRPKIEVQPVEVQVDLDTAKLYQMFVELFSAATPKGDAAAK